jgi:hypothetical protein
VSDKEQIQLKPGQWLDDTRDDIDLSLLRLMVSKLAAPKTYTQAEQDAATAYAARLIKAAMSKPWDGIVR